MMNRICQKNGSGFTLGVNLGVDFKRNALIVLMMLLGLADFIFIRTVEAKTTQGNRNENDISPEQRQKIMGSYGKLPLSFIENRGQADKRVGYYAQSAGKTVSFTKEGYTLHLTQSSSQKLPEKGMQKEIQKEIKAHTIKVEFVGVDKKGIKPEGRERASGVVSYFKGPKEAWKSGIPTYAQVGYRAPWPGIDLSYNGDGGRLEAIYTVAPHANPSQIKLRYSGQDSLKIDQAGNLVYNTSVGEVKETAPVVYQEIDGKRTNVKGAFALLDKRTVGFTVAAYNHKHPLIIDPVLVYAGYIGGNNYDVGTGIAVDSEGNAYVTGHTASDETTFPVAVGPDLTYHGDSDAFIAKVNASGTALVYAGYIGGIGNDVGTGIAVDSAGNAYVTGYTVSNETTFPVAVGPDLIYNNGSYDAFVAKVNASGTALVYAGYIGGDNYDYGNGIAVDSTGNAYITGRTGSHEVTFPVAVGPDLTYYNGAYSDAFVAKVNASGTALVYAGYIGGNNYDVGNGIAVDSAGNAYITGHTGSDETTFPVAVGPDLTYNGAYSDAFVAKVNASGTALVYAGYIGGDKYDFGNGIAVDSEGNAYVTGYTGSHETTFPVAVGPDLTYIGAYSDAFVAKVNASGTALVYAGYIGGNNYDVGNGIAVDSEGNAYITGSTGSDETTFPVAIGPDLTYNGAYSDAFVAKVNASGTALVYAGYIGGNSYDYGKGIAVDSAGNAYIAGSTASNETTFPMAVGPDLTYNYGYDAFVAKVGIGTPPTITVIKTLIPSTDPGKFNLLINGVIKASNVGDGGTTGAVIRPLGPVTVSETAGTSTSLANYTTVIGGACAADGTLTLAAGENKTCTITNTRR